MKQDEFNEVFTEGAMAAYRELRVYKESVESFYRFLGVTLFQEAREKAWEQYLIKEKK